MVKISKGEQIFRVCNTAFLICVSVLCLLPIINVLSISFSSSAAAAAGKVSLFPVDFTLSSYRYALGQKAFFDAFFITIQRTFAGTAISLFVVVLTAYPLSKEASEFPQRTYYAWFFFFTMLFNGGLVPTYMIIRNLGLIDSIWVLIIPGAMSVWNTILFLNFIRGLPKDVFEAAFIDGASHFTTLFKMVLPMAKPAIATIALFTIVGHWNSWFDGLIFMNDQKKFPLQTYMQSITVSINFERLQDMDEESLKRLSEISNRTFKAAQIFLATFPILIAYPFLQKYFVKGIVIGSVKG